MAAELPKMNGIVIAGTTYVLEKDCRANVNAALSRTAKERTALRAALLHMMITFEHFQNDARPYRAALGQARAALNLAQETDSD